MVRLFKSNLRIIAGIIQFFSCHQLTDVSGGFLAPSEENCLPEWYPQTRAHHEGDHGVGEVVHLVQTVLEVKLKVTLNYRDTEVHAKVTAHEEHVRLVTQHPLCRLSSTKTPHLLFHFLLAKSLYVLQYSLYVSNRS